MPWMRTLVSGLTRIAMVSLNKFPSVVELLQECINFQPAVQPDVVLEHAFPWRQSKEFSQRRNFDYREVFVHSSFRVPLVNANKIALAVVDERHFADRRGE